MGAIGLLAAVEEVEGFDDPPAVLVVFQGDGLLVEPGLGVGRCVLSVGNGDPAEVLRGGTAHVHVASSCHGHPLGRRHEPDGRVGGEVRHFGVGDRSTTLHTGTEPVARTFVEGPVADHDISDASGDRKRCLLNGSRRRAAAVVDAREERQVIEAQAAGDVDIGVGVGTVGAGSLDFARGNPGIVERSLHRFDREAQL